MTKIVSEKTQNFDKVAGEHIKKQLEPLFGKEFRNIEELTTELYKPKVPGWQPLVAIREPFQEREPAFLYHIMEVN